MYDQKINLFYETLKKLTDNNLFSDDIIYIGTNPNTEPPYYSCTWAEFIDLANFKYDNGYGGAEVYSKLVIIFKDGSFMERGEYDGAEWWDVYKPFTIPTDVKILTRKIIKSG